MRRGGDWGRAWRGSNNCRSTERSDADRARSVGLDGRATQADAGQREGAERPADATARLRPCPIDVTSDSLRVTLWDRQVCLDVGQRIPSEGGADTALARGNACSVTVIPVTGIQRRLGLKIGASFDRVRSHGASEINATEVLERCKCSACDPPAFWRRRGRRAYLSELAGFRCRS